ncbi:MAG TPA: peptide chain release factor N(5)-glutamine methyltransferase [Stellaceae bacterium]|nr:peptide chain release factor N(5)-glutamine methyltransferase [Stellaceae bacterium]
MAVTVGSMLGAAATALAKAGHLEPRRRGRQLIAGALGVSAAELLAMSERVLDCTAVKRLHGLIWRLAEGEPLSRILGRREFWGLDFELSRFTLDPRPETETVIAAVLARIDRGHSDKVLDLGTGSGCLLLALLSELPLAAGIGVDCLEGAVTTARRNARLLGLADRCRFLVGRWGAAITHRFDIIVANPPYIATSAMRGLPYEVKEFDPPSALDGGEDGLNAYRVIASELRVLSAPSALFVCEIGAGQAAAVAAILDSHGLHVEGTERDLSGIERCVVARYTVDQLSDRA